MGTSLTGLTPATTYDALIKVGDNGPITSTLKTLSDGLGNDLPMEASTTAINFTNQLQQNGVAVPTASQVAAKQDTLVSGTNIKTINGTSVLGSGNIVTPTTSPSGVSGAIQFSDGSAFASDATNLFWDNTNKRLGIGTNAPTQAIHTTGNGRFGNTIIRSDAFLLGTGGGSAFSIYGDQTLFRPILSFYPTGNNMNLDGLLGVGLASSTTVPSARTHIKGTGSTSATTSFLVQNSAGTQALKVDDSLRTTVNNLNITSNYPSLSIGSVNSVDFGDGLRIGYDGAVTKVTLYTNAGTPQLQVNNSGQISVGTTSPQASAKFEIASTTLGFLPPRMTTTQKNAITTPASGLVVYDTTTNKLCCYNGSTWNDLF